MSIQSILTTACHLYQLAPFIPHLAILHDGKETRLLVHTLSYYTRSVYAHKPFIISQTWFSFYSELCLCVHCPRLTSHVISLLVSRAIITELFATMGHEGFPVSWLIICHFVFTCRMNERNKYSTKRER